MFLRVEDYGKRNCIEFQSILTCKIVVFQDQTLPTVSVERIFQMPLLIFLFFDTDH